VNHLKRQINNALNQIIAPYHGETPFHLYLKNTFQKNKNWGSKDRRNYRNICYTYWRNYTYLTQLNNENLEDALLQILENPNSECLVHPYKSLKEHISPEINFSLLNVWFLNNPPVYFLLNPKFKTDFMDFKMPFDGTIELEKDGDYSSLIADGKGIIQDISSTLSILEIVPSISDKTIWDCCAGAGGKSLALKMLGKPKSILGSDIRESILVNYAMRFQNLKIEKPKTIKIDLNNTTEISKIEPVDFILADMPCSGSGTWRKTPENLAFFDPSGLAKISHNQFQYLDNIATKVKKGGNIYYLTCSIFENENENVINTFIQKNKNFSVVFQQYFGGPEKNADFIFGALLRRES